MMGVDTTSITAVVGILVALSVASERLVEITKGIFPALDKAITDDPSKESRRRALLQVLAVVSGVVTAFLSSSYLPESMQKPAGSWGILGLGLLASGGSGLWNSVLDYMGHLKDLKKLEVQKGRAGQ